MAYNPKNKYKTIIVVQDFYLEQKELGVTDKRIIERLGTEKNIFISKMTFYTYLSINAKRELKKLEDIEKQQFKLF